MSDTRTNSGVDNISVFRKMHHWSVPGERIIAMMTAGNLATTQSCQPARRAQQGAFRAAQHPAEAPTMFQVATIVGKLLRDTIAALRQRERRGGRAPSPPRSSCRARSRAWSRGCS
jgi:putative proteasome-type protease